MFKIDPLLDWVPDMVIRAVASDSLMRNDNAFMNFNTLSSSNIVNKCVSESMKIAYFVFSLRVEVDSWLFPVFVLVTDDVHSFIVF